MKVENWIQYDHVSSDLVYPDLISNDRLLKRVVVIDSEYVKSQLKMKFGNKVSYIANKYVIKVDDMLWYQHDNFTWLLAEGDEKTNI